MKYLKSSKSSNLLENIYEKNIKILRSDSGGEFTSTEFKEFYKEDGIKREINTPYNPQTKLSSRKEE